MMMRLRKSCFSSFLSLNEENGLKVESNQRKAKSVNKERQDREKRKRKDFFLSREGVFSLKPFFKIRLKHMDVILLQEDIFQLLM